MSARNTTGGSHKGLRVTNGGLRVTNGGPRVTNGGGDGRSRRSAPGGASFGATSPFESICVIGTGGPDDRSPARLLLIRSRDSATLMPEIAMDADDLGRAMPTDGSFNGQVDFGLRPGERVSGMLTLEQKRNHWVDHSRGLIVQSGHPDWMMLLIWEDGRTAHRALMQALDTARPRLMSLQPHHILPALYLARGADGLHGHDFLPGRAMWSLAEAQRGLLPLIQALLYHWIQGPSSAAERYRTITGVDLTQMLAPQQQSALDVFKRVTGDEALDVLMRAERPEPAIMRALDDASATLWRGANERSPADRLSPTARGLLPLARWRQDPVGPGRRDFPFPSTMNDLVAGWESWVRHGASPAHRRLAGDANDRSNEITPLLQAIEKWYGFDVARSTASLPVVADAGLTIADMSEEQWRELSRTVPTLRDWPFDDVILDCTAWLREISADNIRTGQAVPHAQDRRAWLRVTRGEIWTLRQATYSPWIRRPGLYRAPGSFATVPPGTASLVLEWWTMVDGRMLNGCPTISFIPIDTPYLETRYTTMQIAAQRATDTEATDARRGMVSLLIWVVADLNRRARASDAGGKADQDAADEELAIVDDLFGPVRHDAPIAYTLASWPRQDAMPAWMDRPYLVMPRVDTLATAMTGNSVTKVRDVLSHLPWDEVIVDLSGITDAIARQAGTDATYAERAIVRIRRPVSAYLDDMPRDTPWLMSCRDDLRRDLSDITDGPPMAIEIWLLHGTRLALSAPIALFTGPIVERGRPLITFYPPETNRAEGGIPDEAEKMSSVGRRCTTPRESAYLTLIAILMNAICPRVGLMALRRRQRQVRTLPRVGHRVPAVGRVRT